ncbi:MAG: hypothetical protein M5U34_21710 [Chloroflexi bacterium]|nr:hypothetical protein [Chloroflexota bacterium]
MARGGTTSVDVAQDADTSNMNGMGFTILLPTGLVNGAKQVTNQNGEPLLVSPHRRIGRLDVCPTG